MELSPDETTEKVLVRVDNDDEYFMVASAFPLLSRRGLHFVAQVWGVEEAPKTFPHEIEFKAHEIFMLARGLNSSAGPSGQGMNDQFREAANTVNQYIGAIQHPVPVQEG